MSIPLLLAVIAILVYIIVKTKRDDLLNYTSFTWTSLDEFAEEVGVTAITVRFDKKLHVEMLVNGELLESESKYMLKPNIRNLLTHEYTGHLHNLEFVWPAKLNFKISGGILSIFKGKHIYFIGHA